ncbi:MULTISPECIES: arginase [unclassified Sedimentibacter]|uniref:arginase n=1 Tax=unclassified Sedimentibacter TaxID=2649220 RepID=UPI0027DEF5C1|nr:arginase [Sedimentibacter sp. MB35-C1]WMJ76409.1 arginase [Sedimentibacter sp. MB35-C1]
MKSSINSKISIIGVSIDLGAGTPGVSLGPAAIRYAGVTERLTAIGYDVKDEGDILANKPVSPLSDGIKLRYLEEVARVNTELCNKVSEVMVEGRFPLVLGGDHSIAIGTIAGVLQNKKNLGVIWFDAHGDINTEETSPTGNIHGMPVAVSLGIGHESLTSIGGNDSKLMADKIVFIGCRDLDQGERKILKKLGITVFTMHEIDRYGMADIIERAIKIAGNGTDGIHVSFDMDSIDPTYVHGTGTRVPGGLTLRESHLALEMIALSEQLVSAEFVEVNPIIDTKNQTAKTAVTLMGSLLGEWLI